MDDSVAMQLALAQACSVEGRTSPRPPVGAVVVRDVPPRSPLSMSVKTATAAATAVAIATTTAGQPGRRLLAVDTAVLGPRVTPHDRVGS